MYFTSDQAAALLKQYAPLLKKVVRQACVRYNLPIAQEYEDLYQSACEGFLRHLSRINSADRIGRCAHYVYHHVTQDVRRMYVVSISRDKFDERRNDFDQVSMEYADTKPLDVQEDDWITSMTIAEFIDGKAANEREAILLKAENNCPNKDLIPILGVQNEMGASRFFKKIRRELSKMMDSDNERG